MAVKLAVEFPVQQWVAIVGDPCKVQHGAYMVA